jgi:hypothetical protein
MFYILVSRVPFVYNIGNKREKLFRTFLIGSVCYIILHGLLYSKRFSNNEFVEKYKKYLLYLVGADLSLASSIIYFLDKKTEDQENSYIEDVSDNDNDDNHTIEENNDKMTREQILQNFYRNQMMAQQQAMLAQQQTGSPFINKTGAEELKKKPTENVIESKESKESKELKEKDKEVKSISSEKKNNDELELSNADDIQSKLSEKNKSLDKLLEVISDTDIPLYQPLEVQQKN